MKITFNYASWNWLQQRASIKISYVLLQAQPDSSVTSKGGAPAGPVWEDQVATSVWRATTV